MAVCPLYRATGREGAVARGKLNLWELFQAGRLTSPEALRDFLEFCLLCGACADKCAVGLEVPELVKVARAEIGSQTGSLFRPSWLLARLAWQAPHLIPRAAPFAPLLNRLKNWLGAESGDAGGALVQFNRLLGSIPPGVRRRLESGTLRTQGTVSTDSYTYHYFRAHATIGTLMHAQERWARAADHYAAALRVLPSNPQVPPMFRETLRQMGVPNEDIETEMRKWVAAPDGVPK